MKLLNKIKIGNLSVVLNMRENELKEAQKKYESFQKKVEKNKKKLESNKKTYEKVRRVNMQIKEF